MMHPSTSLSLVSPEIGYGVYATEFIPAGTIVYVADPLEILVEPDDPRLDVPALRDVIEKYSYIDENGVRIVSWDTAKYVNHSCNPNTMSTGYGFEIAVRDIHPGDEVTDEYGMLNISSPLHCRCGAPRCRGIVRAEDLDELHAEWDECLQAALALSSRVPQPLGPLLDEAALQRIDDFVRLGEGYVSVAALRHRAL